MKSFTKKLVLNCTGVIFISFLIVYFLFNVMVGRYIRAEAERELAGGMMDVVHLTGAFPTLMFTEAASAPYHSVRVHTHGQMPPMRAGRFEMELRPDYHWTVAYFYDGELLTDRLAHMQDGILESERIIIAQPDGELSEWEGEWEGAAHLTFRPTRQQSFVTTDVIMMGAGGELIAPRPEFLPYPQRAEVEFLVDFYSSNRARLVDDGMTRVANGGSTFYLSTTRQAINDSTISILMYTDISPAMEFTGSMNRILGLLLVLSGLLSLVISVAMSARFKRAVVRLCSYADTIGRGNFNETAGAFKDTEFDRLSKSMENMSVMLQAYESNQKQFFQNVSHELRTPLMSILGYAEGIMKDIFTKEEAADIILSEGQKMAVLVEELLYVSRIDNSREAPGAISNLDVKGLLYECCEKVRPIAHKSDKTVDLMPSQREVYLETEYEKLERAITNILSNAIRHANSHVEISYHIVGSSLEIIVEDDGNGVNPEDLPHIFERLYKGENGNYGLGLAISKDIVKGLGGDITAVNKNAPESGAVFTILLQL